MPQHRRQEILKLHDVFTTKATTFEKRQQEFKKILKIHYRWANERNIRIMIRVIYDRELKIQASIHARYLVDTHLSTIMELFGKMDTDQNGGIDSLEFQKMLPEGDMFSFVDVDADNDGVISVNEFVGWLTKNRNLIDVIHHRLEVALNEKQVSRRNRLDQLFVSYPTSPGSGWRPSLSMLHSPQTQRRHYYASLETNDQIPIHLPVSF